MPIPAPRGGVFQSTLPAGGATEQIYLYLLQTKDFNPRSPQGERRVRTCVNGRDPRGDFNPRSPQGERLFSALRLVHCPNFNPRSPQGERRFARRHIRYKNLHFNPRSPQGERLRNFSSYVIIIVFQSTLPAGGATCRIVIDLIVPVCISIHAPRRGSDRTARAAKCASCKISIHAPRRGERPSFRTRGLDADCISIHAPRRGSDLHRLQCACNRLHFNPRSPQGERHCLCPAYSTTSHFNPRSPQGERR